MTPELKACPCCHIIPELISGQGYWGVACERCGKLFKGRESKAQTVACWNAMADIQTEKRELLTT